MLRAAAKNSFFPGVDVDTADYPTMAPELTSSGGMLTLSTRRNQAAGVWPWCLPASAIFGTRARNIFRATIGVFRYIVCLGAVESKLEAVMTCQQG